VCHNFAKLASSECENPINLPPLYVRSDPKKREMNLPFEGMTKFQSVLRALTLMLSFALVSSAFAGVWDEGDVVNGESLFKANCASCHKITAEVLAAPGLAGIKERWGASDEMLVKWIQNPQGAAETGDPYVKSLVERYVPTYGWMTAQAVSASDVADIMAYVQAAPAPVSNGAAGPVCETIPDEPIDTEENSSAIWFLILFVLFVIIAVSAGSVKKGLENAKLESEGKPVLPDMSYADGVKAWAWRHLGWVSIAGLFLTAVFITMGYKGAMDVGVYEGYYPEQPIKFYHSIHVCENEVDCQYCHSSASKSKHAGIPSTNVCMNCHKGIKNGSRWGTEELGKIYDAIGFNPENGQYIDDYEEKPIEWVKVHNLPDHVYFNHSQHVEVAGLQCQNCHGDVQTFKGGRVAPVEEINALVNDYPGIIQLSKPTLTMGWCIECHNKAEVGVTTSDNGYYEEIHNRLKDNMRGNEELRKYLEDEKVTVKDLGGWECSKCHY